MKLNLFIIVILFISQIDNRRTSKNLSDESKSKKAKKFHIKDGSKKHKINESKVDK